MSDKQSPIEAQIEISQRLQSSFLRHMEKLLDSGTITSTDMATLARLFLLSGWTLDPKQLPESIKALMKKPLTSDFGDEPPVVITWQHPDRPEAPPLP